MTELELVVYQDDDETPLFSVGTAATHPNPFLRVPDQFGEAEVDLRAGTSVIGQINLPVIDPQTGATQAERFLSALLGNAAGFSRLNGRRALLRQVAPAAVAVIDGVVGGVTLNDTFAGFTLSLRDVRERGRKVKLFTTGGTSTVFPRGVLNGYGAIPGGGWLVPPTSPIEGTFEIRSGTGGGRIRLPDRPPPGQPVASFVLTPAMREVGKPRWDQEAEAFIFPDLEVWWRLAGSGGTWHKHGRMPTYTGEGFGGKRFTQSLMFGRRATIQDADGNDVEVDLVSEVWLYPTAEEPILPADGAAVEVMVVYVGEPSNEYPWHFEGTAGELLRNVYRGDYSDRDPRIRIDETRFVGGGAIPALNTAARLRITKPEEDLRKWTEKVYRALRAAPALDTAGRVAPIDSRLPPVVVELVQLDDSNCEPLAGWDHPVASAVTMVRTTYHRDYRIPVDVDPVGDDSAGDGIATVEQERIHRAPDEVISIIGEKPLEIDGFLFRAIGGSRGAPITGDVADETGAQVAAEAAAATIDRFAYGGQAGFFRAAQTDAGVAALQVGDWVIDARSWRPNYLTGERGGNTLAQVVSIRDLNPAWREIRTIDAAPADQPIPQPVLGTPTAAATGVVTISVTTVAAGAEARVDYAVSATEPPTNSELWTYAGRTSASGSSVATPALPAGTRVWIRGRSEGVGRRSSAWTASVTLVTPLTPRLFRLTVDFTALGQPVALWGKNVAAQGLRLRWEIHPSTEEPTGAWEGTVDVDADLLEHALAGVLVAPGEAINIEGVPWTGWTGSALSGTPGTALVASARMPWIAAGTIDLVVDPVTGQVYFTPLAQTPEARSWRARVVVGTVGADDFADPLFVDATGDLEFSGGPSTLGIRQDAGVALSAGQAAYLVGYFFDTSDPTSAAQLAARRSIRVPAWRPRDAAGPDASPIVDEDNAELYLYPNRNALSQSVKWVTRTDRAPTLAETQAGAVSTSESIPAHSFDPLAGEQTAWVGVIPYSAADGTGTAGPLRVRTHTFTTANDVPGLTATPKYGSAADREAVELVATDDGDQVAILHRVFAEGSTPPAYTRTPASGYSADPLIHTVEAVVPLEGASALLLEAYAIDADGNASPRLVRRIDASTWPSGSLALRVNADGDVSVVANSTDPDAGSWRARVVRAGEEDFEAPTYADGQTATTWEGGGSAFGVEVPTGLVLTTGQRAYLVGYLYRTTSDVAATQQTSRRGGVLRDVGALPSDVSNYGLLYVGVEEIDVDAGEFVIAGEVGTKVEEIHVFAAELPAATVNPYPKDNWVGAPVLFPTDGDRTFRFRVPIPKLANLEFVKVEPRAPDEQGRIIARSEGREFVLSPLPPVLGAKLRAAVTNGTADLSLEQTAPSSSYPVTASIYLGDPNGAPVVVHEFAAPGTIGPGEYGALNDVALPLRGGLPVFARLVDVAGNVFWASPVSPDRDPLPNVYVTVTQYRSQPVIRVDYDDDVDAVRITTPGGVKTWSGLSGSGSVTYTLGTTVRDSGGVESLLAVDQVRTGYLVEAQGGGVWITGWSGDLAGPPSNPPTVDPRVEVAASGATASVTARLTSPVGERVGLRIRDSESAAAPEWYLCQGLNNAAPRFVNSATEVGPADYFTSGGTPALQKLKDIPLLRDQIDRIYLAAIGEQSGVRGSLLPVTLDVKQQPWLETIALTFDEATDQLTLRAIVGAFAQSVALVIDDDPSFATPKASSTVNVVDGQTATLTAAVLLADRGKTWYGRAIGYSLPNGAAGGGLASSTYVDPEYVGNDPTTPEPSMNFVRFVEARYPGVSGFDEVHVELYLEYGGITKSIRVIWAKSDGSLTGNFTLDPTAGPSTVVVALRQTTGSPLVIFDYDDTSDIELTITPYTGVGGTGSAGTPKEHVVSGPLNGVRGIVLAKGSTTVNLTRVELGAGVSLNNDGLGVIQEPISATVSGSTTPNFSSTGIREYSLSGNTSFNSPSGTASGGSYLLVIDTNGRSVTFSSDYRWPGGDPPSMVGTVLISIVNVDGAFYCAGLGDY